MQAADARHAGQTFADLANEPGLPILSAEVALRFGADSLYRPRRARPDVDLSVLDLGDAPDAEDTQELIRQRNLYALTPQRAGRFVEKHLPAKGARVSTAELQMSTEDDLLDLLAVLAFERAGGATPHKPLRWRVTSDRVQHGLEPEKTDN